MTVPAFMRAAQLRAPGDIRSVAAPTPVPGPGDALVRTLRTTVCGSDVHVTLGELTPPAFPCPVGYPGHESVGVVVDDGTVGTAGTAVLAVPHPHQAQAFAEYQVLPRAHCLPLPSVANPRDLVVAQQLGTVLFALRRFWPASGPGECAAVLGAGAAGLFFVQRLKAMGFRSVVAVDPIAGRRARALRLGADVVGDAAEGGKEAVLDVTGGRGADLVVEASGRDRARAAAVELVAIGGRVGLFGLPERPGDVLFPVHGLLRRRATLEACSGAQEEPALRSFREAIDLLARGAVHGQGFITHRRAIDDIGEALGLAAAPGEDVVKVAVDFEVR